MICTVLTCAPCNPGGGASGYCGSPIIRSAEERAKGGILPVCGTPVIHKLRCVPDLAIYDIFECRRVDTFPLLHEQHAIAAVLDRETARIDAHTARIKYF